MKGNIKWIIGLVVLVVGGCTPHQNHSTSKIMQGVKGKVLWVEGNQMPSFGRDKPQPKPEGVVREIYFCKASASSQLQGEAPLYQGIEGQVFAQTTSNAQGHFAIELPVGTYSVFTKEETGFFANIFDGQGIINPVTVSESQVTNFNININYQASY